MNKKEFIESYCKKSGITKKELLKTQKVIVCNCGEEGCNGFAVISKNK